MTFYNNLTGASTTIAFVANTLTCTGVYTWISFNFTNDSIDPVKFSLLTENVRVQGGLLYSPYPVELPYDTQVMRISLLTGLVTYTGSTLNNQGNIVMAMTDPNWEQEASSLYDALSTLPDRRYNGPAKRGSYGWWSPQSVEEETPQNTEYFDRMPEVSCLRFAIQGMEPGQSLKIEGNIGIEFNSPQQVFSHVPCQPKTPLHDHLSYFFNHLPHVMPNDEHDDVCKGLIGKVNKTISSAAKNPGALALGILALA
jgi:hypothetical protein